MASNNNNNVSIWEEWSSDSGEPVDLQLTGALLCVGRLLDRHNLVARGCMRACVRACVRAPRHGGSCPSKFGRRL